MPTSVPLTTKNPGDVLTSTLWNTQLKQNLDKLLNAGHRTLTVAQFAALTSPEGTKGVVAGDEVYLEVDATNGVIWHLVYESTETTYKWRFLGGPALYSEVVATEVTGGTVYQALTTAGPSIPLPRAGDYDVNVGAGAFGVAASSFMSYDIGGTAAVDADGYFVNPGAGNLASSGSRPRRKTALTAVTLTAKYKSAVTGQSFLNRWMQVTPARLI